MTTTTTKQETTNNWTERLVKAVSTMRTNLAKSEAIVPTMALQHVQPFLTILIDGGSVKWEPSSTENVKTVTKWLMDHLAIGSVKGIAQGTQDYHNARTDAANFARALHFLAACHVLKARTGLDANADKLRVPVLWVMPEAREYDDTSDQMVPCNKLVPIMKMRQAVPLKQDTGMYASLTVEATMTSIIASAFGTKKRAAKTDDAKPGLASAEARGEAAPSSTQSTDDASNNGSTSSNAQQARNITLREVFKFAHSGLARADYVVSGETSDELFDLLAAFCAANEGNRAVVLGIATNAKFGQMTEYEQDQSDEIMFDAGDNGRTVAVPLRPVADSNDALLAAALAA